MEQERNPLPAKSYQGINAQEINESGIDYIWGSDQDELVDEKAEREKK
jgi:hypothetical protein